ncbi:RICIN domain-containing protein [Streptomyces swartbergensis]|uniref:RICIN domain-containing protein n=1 Tax=Streptomyces swartbergensis TaxID=487165 RepID=UPI003823899C
MLVNPGSGKALDAAGASTADGASLSQWARHDGANQRFHFVDSGRGYYRLKAQHSGKVLPPTRPSPSCSSRSCKRAAGLRAGMTVSPCRTHDLGGGVTGPVGRRWRR